MTQGIQEQVRPLPTVEAKGHFVQVGREMLGADTVPRAHDSTLQEGEGIFDCVGVDVTLDVNLGLMLNPFVLPLLNSRLGDGVGVNGVLVSHQHINVGTDVLADVPSYCSLLYIAGMKESQFAIALADANYDLLCVVSESRLVLASMMLPAYVGFVYFNRAIQHGAVYFFHCSPDAMAQIPSGFVAYPEGSLDLIGTHALAGFAQQQSGDEPSHERQMGIIEDRTSGYGELVVAILAVEQLLFSRQFNRWTFATRTLRTFRPAQAAENFAALFVSGVEVGNIQ